MGLINRLRNEFIDIIEWVDDTQDTIVWKFPRYQNAIKNGAQLTVRESQVAVLVNEGQFADVFQPGRYELTTKNMPILTTLMGWKYGFNSPFKVDIYFVNTKQFLDQKWGTKNPIMLRDPEFGPIRIRAFGSFCFKVQNDPKQFITSVSGTNSNFTTEGIAEQIRNFIITRFTDAVAESKIPVLDMAANLNEYSEKIQEIIKPSADGYGLDLTQFLVENISLPEAVQEALDRRSSMGIIGKDNMNAYTQMQFADSLGKEGGAGMAGDAMGMGMGFAMAGQMAQAFSQPGAQQPPQAAMGGMAGGAVPPPMPGAAPSFFVAVNGQQAGPYTMMQLQGFAQQGQLLPDTLVWTSGMPQWAAAKSVPALQSLFAPNTPPTIPGSGMPPTTPAL